MRGCRGERDLQEEKSLRGQRVGGARFDRSSPLTPFREGDPRGTSGKEVPAGVLAEKGPCWSPRVPGPCQHAEAGSSPPACWARQGARVHVRACRFSGRSQGLRLCSNLGFALAHADCPSIFPASSGFVGRLPGLAQKPPLPQLMNARRDGVLLLTLGDLRWGRL